MIKIMEKLTLKLRTATGWLDRKYLSACNYLGVKDSEETRTFAAVAVCASLFFVCYTIGKIVAFVSTGTIMAIINQ